MSNNVLNVRIQEKYDLTENWNKLSSFVPLEGEIIIYLDHTPLGDGSYEPGVKIGDGTTLLARLPFLGSSVEAALQAHINNTNVHLQDGERNDWNSKVDCTVENNTLVLFR